MFFFSYILSSQSLPSPSYLFSTFYFLLVLEPTSVWLPKHFKFCSQFWSHCIPPCLSKCVLPPVTSSPSGSSQKPGRYSCLPLLVPSLHSITEQNSDKYFLNISYIFPHLFYFGCHHSSPRSYHFSQNCDSSLPPFTPVPQYSIFPLQIA